MTLEEIDRIWNDEANTFAENGNLIRKLVKVARAAKWLLEGGERRFESRYRDLEGELAELEAL